jgi:prolipoprotein diacylglyceryltransferase
MLENGYVSAIFLGKKILNLWKSGYSLMTGMSISSHLTLIFLLIRRRDFLYFFDLYSKYVPVGIAAHRI